jgi:membrane-associated phospholipid phosphatase
VGLFGAGLAAWVLAKVVKEVAERGRPAALLPDVVVRGDWVGLGFPSGHVAVAFSLAMVADAYLRGAWRWAAWAVAAATGVMRMYTAAHLPLDVVGGAGLGVAIGAAVRLAMSSRRTGAQSPSGRST